jgi:plasmid stabilization system protein ParE
VTYSLLEARHFYRRKGGSKLANRFLDEFERVVALLIRFPGIGTPADELRRVHPL